MAVEDLKLTKIPAVKVEMLIRRPPDEVFDAFRDPAITTRFWFSKSIGGELVPGAKLQWIWEMYGITADVHVKEVEENSRIVFEWAHGDSPTTVEFRFIPWVDQTTYVQVTETGISGTGDEIVSYVADSTGGFSFTLAAAKALLEHGVVLRVVLDHHPEGLSV